ATLVTGLRWGERALDEHLLERADVHPKSPEGPTLDARPQCVKARRGSDPHGSRIIREGDHDDAGRSHPFNGGERDRETDWRVGRAAQRDAPEDRPASWFSPSPDPSARRRGATAAQAANTVHRDRSPPGRHAT